MNFPPKQIGPFVSEVLVMGAYTEAGKVVLLRPDFEVAPGARIGSAAGRPRNQPRAGGPRCGGGSGASQLERRYARDAREHGVP